MKEQKRFSKRLKDFIKRNSYPLVVAGSTLVLAVALVITATMSAKVVKQDSGVEPEVQQKPNNETIITIPKEEAQASNTTPVVFNFPVKDYTLGNTYSDEKLIYNQTLKEYTTHLGIDFLVQEGAEVMASFDGTVESITYDNLTGTVVTIDHGEGLKTIYSSLNNNVSVVEGQSVKSGEVIGNATASQGEQSLGAHVHLEVTKDGEYVNPMIYLGEK